MLQDYKIDKIKLRCKELNVSFNNIVDVVMSRISYKKIMDILSLKEWEDKKFQPLLTSNIWASNYDNIKNILIMEEWNDVKYVHLLSPSILPLNPDKIRKSITLAHKFNIDGYITVSFIRKPLKQLYAIANYLEHLKIPLITENGKLHSFFNYQTTVLKKKYNINLKILTKIYPMPNDFLERKVVK